MADTFFRAFPGPVLLVARIIMGATHLRQDKAECSFRHALIAAVYAPFDAVECGKMTHANPNSRKLGFQQEILAHLAPADFGKPESLSDAFRSGAADCFH
jgi:hypothetical protein